MALVTPDYFVDWATNADAEQTDPGSPLTADGYDVGDAPASSHYNYTLNHAAGYASFVPRVLPSSVAWGNIDFDAAAFEGPWDNDWNLFHCMYNEEANRWHVIARDLSAGTVSIYDSEDGENWNSALNITGSSENINEITRPIVGAGKFVFGIDNKVYTSTDSTLANINGGTSTFDQLTAVREMVYDPVNAIWVAVGEETPGDGAIDVAVTSDGNFSTQQTFGGDTADTIAVSPAGEFVVFLSANATCRTSTDGLTWGVGGNPGEQIGRVVWSPFLNAFLAIGTAQGLYVSQSAGAAWSDIGISASSLISTKDFIWARDPLDESMTSLRPLGTYNGYDDLGFMHVGMTTGGTYSELYGGQGKVMWPWPATIGNSNKAVAYYGAKHGS